MARAQHESTDRQQAPVVHRIGRYTVIDRLGSGGMAVVHRVRDDQGRVYALKELKSPGEMGARFKKEFEVVRRIEHPNIVRMTECFEAQQTMHIVMEFVDGLDLRELLAHYGPLPDSQVALIGAEIAAGLAHAHRQGVLHRDLKPENVMLNRQGQVRIMDFGVARVLGTRMTTTGIIVGSPGYMSPEQLSGRSGQKLLPSSDIYSLATMLWELGEGEYPLPIKRQMELIEVLGHKLKPKFRAPKQLQNEALLELLRRSLSPDEEARPSSMDEVEAELRSIADAGGASWKQLQTSAESALHTKRLGPDGARKRRVHPGGPPATSRGALAAPMPQDAGLEPRLVAGRSRARPAEAAAVPALRMHSAERRAPAGAEQRVVADPDALRPRHTEEVSKVHEISVRGRGADTHHAISAAALLLFLGAAVFLGASTALTGSPLGLIEAWIPLSVAGGGR